MQPLFDVPAGFRSLAGGPDECIRNNFEGVQRERALALLEEAVGHGLLSQTAVNMDKDEDLKSLYRDPRFAAMSHAPRRTP